MFHRDFTQKSISPFRHQTIKTSTIEISELRKFDTMNNFRTVSKVDSNYYPLLTQQNPNNSQHEHESNMQDSIETFNSKRRMHTSQVKSRSEMGKEVCKFLIDLNVEFEKSQRLYLTLQSKFILK